MLKKLRMRFIAVNMGIGVILLSVIFGLVYHFTRQSLERESETLLQTVAADPLQLNWPGIKSSRLPYFTVRLSGLGAIRVTGSSYYDLTDPDLLSDLIGRALENGESAGRLSEYSLRYCRVAFGGSEYLVFVDISSEEAALRALGRNCVFIGLGAAAAFFLISLLLARWTVRPVEKAWKQQTEFVSDASHELKTPLTVILTNTELLRAPDVTPEQRERSIGDIRTMAERMRQLVESLLSLARADNGAAVAGFQELDLSALAEEAVLPFEPLLFESGRTLETGIEPGIRVRGSAIALRQIVEILLDNARKYADPGTVRLCLERENHRSCLLTVTTPGEPLSPEECAAVFQRFYRGDRSRSGDGSYGLGLSIAESIAREHKGKIWCQGGDRENRFLLRLPTV